MGKERKHTGSREQRHPEKRPVTFKVTREDELMTFLIASLPGKNRNNIKTLLKRRQIIVNGKAITQFNHRLYPGNEVEIFHHRVRNAPELKGVNIVYEDQDVIVVNKRPGLLSVATDREKWQTVSRMVQNYISSDDSGGRIYSIHRLDRETSGLLLFAKNREACDLLKEEWASAIGKQIYLAVVEGIPNPEKGTYSSYLSIDANYVVHSSSTSAHDGKLATTEYKILRKNETYSVLEVGMQPGIKNQIRVQLKELGYPVVGDRKYGSTNSPMLRLGLHCRKLVFTHPSSQKSMSFETAVPGKFLKLMSLSSQDF